MPWVREGSCPPSRCQGRCCKIVGLWFDKDEGFLNSLSTRGLRSKEYKGKTLVEFPASCQYQTASGMCSLHPLMYPDPSLPERPQFCEDWPTEPSQLLLHDYCGFSFRWVEENDESFSGLDPKE